MELADMRLIKDSMEIREGFLEKVTPDLDLEGSVRYFQVDKGDNILDKREKPVQRSKRVYMQLKYTDLSLYMHFQMMS